MCSNHPGIKLEPALEVCFMAILKKTKLNTSSTLLQNRSFHVVERTRTSSKCQKMKNARAKRAKLLFLIVKYANLGGFVAVAVVVFKLRITAELPHKTVPCYCPCPLLLTADQFLKFDFKIKTRPCPQGELVPKGLLLLC